MSEDVSVENTRASLSLAGTLTMPVDNSAKAAVILASGSGAQNRDEEIAGHRPFKTIAESLSERGFAVLRLDDRGTGLSNGDFQSATGADLAEDVRYGLLWLRKRFPDIPAGIIGHSEGGSHAIRAAAGGETDFIVTMGAPAWKGDSVIMS
ncbi:MAG: alpha/beta hydrolase, partial [Muribaculaceae bacterium]|nr:alpha/beta hydrolase [Muribaculaceae bacterium]